MSLYFSSAVDIAVLTMGENPKEVQHALSANPPRGAMSTDQLQVSALLHSGPSVHTAGYSHHAPTVHLVYRGTSA